MRDAFGGVFMIRLFLVFIVIYVAFTAVSLNYAKAFRVKNSVIDFVEQNEILSLDAKDIAGKLKKLDKVLSDANYTKTCKNGNGTIKSVEGKSAGYCYNGIVILNDETQTINDTTKAIKYQVIAYADWNVGMLNKILVLGGQKENSQEYVEGTWAISGEAKVINKRNK